MTQLKTGALIRIDGQEYEVTGVVDRFNPTDGSKHQVAEFRKYPADAPKGSHLHRSGVCLAADVAHEKEAKVWTGLLREAAVDAVRGNANLKEWAFAQIDLLEDRFEGHEGGFFYLPGRVLERRPGKEVIDAGPAPEEG